MDVGPHDDECSFCKGLHWKRYKKLETNTINLSKYVTIDNTNFETYSEEFGDLLVLIGNEIDTFFRDMFACPNVISYIHTNNANTSNVNINTYKKIFNKLYELSENIVFIQYGFGEKFNLKPFDNFYNSTPNWWNAYNGLKHEYYDSIKLGNLENVLNAMSGLFILNALHICSKKYLVRQDVIKTIWNRDTVYGHQIIKTQIYEDAVLKSNIGTSLYESDLFLDTELISFEYRVDDSDSVDKGFE